MNRNRIVVLLAAILSLTGCSHSKWAQIEEMKREQREISAADRQLRSVGLDRDYPLYKRSEFAKNNDVAGYIKFRNNQRVQQEEESTKLYKQAVPSLSEMVRSCVLKSGTPSYYRKDPETCFSQLTDAQKAPLIDKRLGIIPEYRKDEVVGPIGKELKAAHDERVTQEWTDTVMRLRAADRRKVAGQKEASKRAYDNSIQSLVE